MRPVRMIAAALALLGAGTCGASFRDTVYPIRFRADLPPAWRPAPEEARALAAREQISSELRTAWTREGGGLVAVFAQYVPVLFPPDFFLETMPGEIAVAYGVDSASVRAVQTQVAGIPVCQVEARAAVFDPTGRRSADTEAVWWNVEAAGRSGTGGELRYLDALVLFRGPGADRTARREVEAWVASLEIDPQGFAAAPSPAPKAQVAEVREVPSAGVPPVATMAPEDVKEAVTGWLDEALARRDLVDARTVYIADRRLPVFLEPPVGGGAERPGVLLLDSSRHRLDFRPSDGGDPVPFVLSRLRGFRMDGERLVLVAPQGTFRFRVDARAAFEWMLEPVRE